MATDKCERYEISHVPEGLQITLWQTLPSLGFGLITLVILAACFLTDPYPGHGRVWAGLGVGALALVALFGVKVETWIISDAAIRYKSSLWSKEMICELQPGTHLTVQVELMPADSEGTRPQFPHVLHVTAPGAAELGDGLRFRQRSSLDRLLQVLRDAAPIDLGDLRPRPEDADPRGQLPADISNLWRAEG